jgi:hypothetical protein
MEWQAPPKPVREFIYFQEVHVCGLQPSLANETKTAKTGRQVGIATCTQVWVDNMKQAGIQVFQPGYKQTNHFRNFYKLKST